MLTSVHYHRCKDKVQHTRHECETLVGDRMATDTPSHHIVNGHAPYVCKTAQS